MGKFQLPDRTSLRVVRAFFSFSVLLIKRLIPTRSCIFEPSGVSHIRAFHPNVSTVFSFHQESFNTALLGISASLFKTQLWSSNSRLLTMLLLYIFHLIGLSYHFLSRPPQYLVFFIFLIVERSSSEPWRRYSVVPPSTSISYFSQCHQLRDFYPFHWCEVSITPLDPEVTLVAALLTKLQSIKLREAVDLWLWAPLIVCEEGHRLIEAHVHNPVSLLIQVLSILFDCRQWRAFRGLGKEWGTITPFTPICSSFPLNAIFKSHRRCDLNPCPSL